MTPISLTVNGERVDGSVEPRTHLADFLRETLRLTGTHLGCEHGVCGACSILVDGKLVRSCLTYAVQCDGAEVRTIEGFDDDPLMRELRAAFAREHALQCGFCTPGMLIAGRDVVQRFAQADDRRVRIEMSGNLCRCTGYLGIVNAVRSVIEARASAIPAEGAAEPKPAPAAWRSFSAAEAANAPAAAVSADAPLTGATRIEQRFIAEHPPAAVWKAFADMPMVASCLPGAELDRASPESITGRVNVRFGPMKAVFAGDAKLSRDEAAMRGSIVGGGTDSLSGSRAKADISYRLAPLDAGRRTEVSVVMDYTLQGPLAQFSRGAIVNDFVGRMVQDFAGNLNARLGGAAPAAAPAALDAGGWFWSWIMDRIKRIFGGKR